MVCISHLHSSLPWQDDECSSGASRGWSQPSLSAGLQAYRTGERCPALVAGAEAEPSRVSASGPLTETLLLRQRPPAGRLLMAHSSRLASAVGTGDEFSSQDPFQALLPLSAWSLAAAGCSSPCSIPSICSGSSVSVVPVRLLSGPAGDSAVTRW